LEYKLQNTEITHINLEKKQNDKKVLIADAIRNTIIKRLMSRKTNKSQLS
tara:strand:+ start:37820 stop:37969 length:150 start_codon:yes stop_codon:yes gene_type:complete